jgi:hypothetical protein
LFHTRNALACGTKEIVNGNGYKRDNVCERERRSGRGYKAENERLEKEDKEIKH